MAPSSTDPAHYTLSLVNHRTGQRLRLEMVDLPFPSAAIVSALTP